MNRLPVQEAFTGCVKNAGGLALDEVLRQPGFSNADFWFPQDNVVAELKCLSEDYWSRDDFSKSVARMYHSWVLKGWAPAPTSDRTFANLQDLPKQCSDELTAPLKKKLEDGTVKKANRQIRETKEHFGATDAKGLLLLVNDGNFALPPSMVRHLLARILNDKYSSINNVIHFSVNETVGVPGAETTARFWLQWGFGRSPISKEFVEALRNSWFSHLSALTGERVYVLPPSSLEDATDEMRFVRGGAV